MFSYVIAIGVTRSRRKRPAAEPIPNWEFRAWSKGDIDTGPESLDLCLLHSCLPPFPQRTRKEWGTPHLYVT